MRILIIGNNGFVGSKLTDILSVDYDITGIDLCWFGQNLGKSIVMDMADIDHNFLKDYELIICLAAHSSVGMGITDPAGAIRNNVVNMNRLVSLLSDNQKLIYASSASVYGSGQRDVTEQSKSYQLNNFYDITKQIFDDIALDAIKSSKNIIGLRFGSIIGISPNTRTDIAVNNMIYTAHKNGKFWIANSDVYRSWLTVDDAVNAIHKIILSDNFVSGIYNIKSFDCTIGDVAKNITKLTGYNYDIKNSVHTSYDFTISSKKLEDLYNWKPTSTLENTIISINNNINHITECRRDNDNYGIMYGI